MSQIDPEDNYKYGYKTYCSTCMYCFHNTGANGKNKIITKLNGRKKTIQVKHGEMYCVYREPVKINRNHVRWWGFSRSCAFNIYKHTCLGCGIRMCSSKKVCSGCRKNNERFQCYFE